MTAIRAKFFVIFAGVWGCQTTGEGQAPDSSAAESWQQATAGMERSAGSFPFYWNDDQGQLLLEVELGQEFLYFVSLSEGVGSNPLGLDRGAVQSSGLCEFRRSGSRIHWLEKNLRFRARTDQQALVKSVQESFPDSILESFEIVARRGSTCLIDATEFFLRDATYVTETLATGGQGNYQVDPSSSFIAAESLAAFPRNSEFGAWLTFSASPPGPIIQQQAPNGRRLTVRQHHSLLLLPEQGYQPRAYDPRVGTFPLTFYDFARPVDESVRRYWVQRWRLEKETPGPESAPVKKPIVYYLDPGIPDPIREAIREGALWWNEAFAAAGLLNAFEVRDLPADANAMDARYSVIQWVHRAERGWSIGASLADPRTGEILKGAVRMDSHRARADANMALGYGVESCAATTGPGAWATALDEQTDAIDLVLARVRQLAAHEVGHTLGFAHNFKASSYGRASVMDYPAPWIRVKEDGLDFTEAYADGIGEYDKFAIRCVYAPVPWGADEQESLESLVRQGLAKGYRLLSDAAARPRGAADPDACLWDNGPDSLQALKECLQVRQRMLERFPAKAVQPGEPLVLMQKRLIPVYFYHQFALERVIREIGGIHYTYGIEGDGQIPRRRVVDERQRQALELVLATLSPAALQLNPALVQRLGAVPPVFSLASESPPSSSGPVFDQLALGRSLTAWTLQIVLHRERAARLMDQTREDPARLGFGECLEICREHLFADAELTNPERDWRTMTRFEWIEQVIALARDPDARPAVHAEAEWHLRQLGDDLAVLQTAAGQSMAARIRRFLHRPGTTEQPARPPEPPQTSPIGTFHPND